MSNWWNFHLENQKLLGQKSLKSQESRKNVYEEFHGDAFHASAKCICTEGLDHYLRYIEVGPRNQVFRNIPIGAVASTGSHNKQ